MHLPKQAKSDPKWTASQISINRTLNKDAHLAVIDQPYSTRCVRRLGAMSLKRLPTLRLLTQVYLK